MLSSEDLRFGDLQEDVWLCLPPGANPEWVPARLGSRGCLAYSPAALGPQPGPEPILGSLLAGSPIG
jgi:hypothetical protein